MPGEPLISGRFGFLLSSADESHVRIQPFLTRTVQGKLILIADRQDSDYEKPCFGPAGLAGQMKSLSRTLP